MCGGEEVKLSCHLFEFQRLSMAGHVGKHCDCDFLFGGGRGGGTYQNTVRHNCKTPGVLHAAAYMKKGVRLKHCFHGQAYWNIMKKSYRDNLQTKPPPAPPATPLPPASPASSHPPLQTLAIGLGRCCRCCQVNSRRARGVLWP